MIGLDRLLEKPGVVAAGQIDEYGGIKRSAGNMTDEMKSLIADQVMKNNMEFENQVDRISDFADQSWKPLHGWAMWGGKYSLCVVGSTGVVAETAKADFNDIMVSMIGEGPSGPRHMNY